MRSTIFVLVCALSACGSEESDATSRAGHDATVERADAVIDDSASDARDTGTDARDSGSEAIQDAPADTDSSALPTRLHVEGTASGSADGGTDGGDGGDGGADHVECSFFADIDQLQVSANGSITGFVVGEVFRTAFPGDQRFEFSAFIAGEGSVTQLSATDVEARLVGVQPEDAKEFWLALEVIQGQKVGEFSYDGVWTCAPILLNDPGFIDLDLRVPGTWQIRPAP
jgi:hypothetical protein